MKVWFCRFGQGQWNRIYCTYKHQFWNILLRFTPKMSTLFLRTTLLYNVFVVFGTKKENVLTQTGFLNRFEFANFFDIITFVPFVFVLTPSEIQFHQFHELIAICHSRFWRVSFSRTFSVASIRGTVETFLQLTYVVFTNFLGVFT